MDVELEKVFSPEVLAALDERVRRIAREEASRAEVEWLDIPAVMQLTSMTKSAARQFINELKAAESPDVYQPNGPGTRPLVVRRSSLRDLAKKGSKR